MQAIELLVESAILGVGSKWERVLWDGSRIEYNAHHSPWSPFGRKSAALA